MKTLKIGRSSSNDVILDDMTVSSSHAIIEIQDDGNVFIKDLNSKNGTFVNDKPIALRTAIYANDSVRVGNSKVNWMSYVNKPRPVGPVIPQVPVDSNEIVKKITIGRSADNSIVFAQKDISSSHAFIAKKRNGDVVLVDNGSSNGTFVNGQRITIHKLQKGDKILLANKYNLNWESSFDSGKSTKWAQISAIAAVVLLLCVGGWYYLSNRSWSPEKIYSTYSKTEVLIIASYYYQVEIPEFYRGMWIAQGDKCMEIKNESQAIQIIQGAGTGFFISNDGKIVTNKHVVNSWEYKPEQEQVIRTSVQNAIKNQILSGEWNVIQHQNLVNEISITPKLCYLGIIPNNTHYSRNLAEAIPCSVVKTSSTEIDLAIIQTNAKSLPTGVTTIVDVTKADIGGVEVGKKIYSIGFPEGLDLASTDLGIEANNQSGEITQIRGDIVFGHNVTIRNGASGSPVFNEYGNLIGVINAGFAEGYNLAIQAKHVVELSK